MGLPTINTSFNFPNIDIYDITNDNNELLYYEARPQTDYVMYNRNANDTEIELDEYGNPVFDENGNVVERPVTYYYTSASIPKTFNFTNFPFVAVLRSTVDENYIFNIGDNDHEIM